jgi:hypothetical protein
LPISNSCRLATTQTQKGKKRKQKEGKGKANFGNHPAITTAKLFLEQVSREADGL